MATIKVILRRLGARIRREPPDREIEDELRFHLEMRTRDNIMAGMSPEEAAADAMRRFGNFDHIRAICEEIRKECLGGILNVTKGLAWIMVGCGLALKLAAYAEAWQPVGNTLILIASLWRLLIHLREMQPSQSHVRAFEMTRVSKEYLIGDFSAIDLKEHTITPVPAYDKEGRTPVERLISYESPGETNK
ncbi:MAG TPA: permease prefix domain 1-containing protein [Blastocatellia bacterium]|nr:permease prefix domain 1-containing protein [Blastocatellia bacterium]